MTKPSPRLAWVRSWGPALLVGGFGLVIVGGLAVLPVRTWMSQREAASGAEARLATANARAAELEVQLALLRTDSEIERMARENYDLVYPGEESYRILPAPDR